MSLKKQGDDCMVSRYKIRVGDSLYGLYVRYVPYKATALMEFMDDTVALMTFVKDAVASECVCVAVECEFSIELSKSSKFSDIFFLVP